MERLKGFISQTNSNLMILFCRMLYAHFSGLLLRKRVFGCALIKKEFLKVFITTNPVLYCGIYHLNTARGLYYYNNDNMFTLLVLFIILWNKNYDCIKFKIYITVRFSTINTCRLLVLVKLIYAYVCSEFYFVFCFTVHLIKKAIAGAKSERFF